MPHCLIEYADTLEQHIDPQQLLDAVFQTVTASPLFDRKNVRARLQRFSAFRLGAEQQHFVHVTVRLLQGRSDKEKTALNQHIGDAIKKLGITDTSISCECVDVHTPSLHRSTT